MTNHIFNYFPNKKSPEYSRADKIGIKRFTSSVYIFLYIKQTILNNYYRIDNMFLRQRLRWDMQAPAPSSGAEPAAMIREQFLNRAHQSNAKRWGPTPSC